MSTYPAYRTNKHDESTNKKLIPKQIVSLFDSTFVNENKHSKYESIDKSQNLTSYQLMDSALAALENTKARTIEDMG
jgi:hypothetical protein